RRRGPYRSTYLREVAPEPQLARDLRRESDERVELAFAQRARRPIRDRDGADGGPGFDEQRHARVKSNVGIAGDERVVGEAWVLVRVRHDERVPVVDAVAAERKIAIRSRLRHADTGLEPLAVRVHERDERNLGAADVGREARDLVERRLGLGVD